MGEGAFTADGSDDGGDGPAGDGDLQRARKHHQHELVDGVHASSASVSHEELEEGADVALREERTKTALGQRDFQRALAEHCAHAV